MTRMTTTGRAIGGAGITIALLVFAVLWSGTASPAEATTQAWPKLTMVYQADGPAYSAGSNKGVVRETRRLNYTSDREWTDTVTEGTSISTAYGTFSTTGSYRRLSGTTYTEYDAITGDLSTETLPSGENLVSHPALIPGQARMLESGYSLTPSTQSVSAAICYKDGCEDTPVGRAYATPGGGTWVSTDDTYGILLSAGDFNVVSLTYGVNKPSS